MSAYPRELIISLEEQLKLSNFQKNNAYTERNMLVAALSKLFPASLERHIGEDWDPDWAWVVIIDLPTGQISFHIPTSEMRFFDHLPREVGRTWDGHTTPEKYGRLFELKPLFIYPK